MTNKINFICTMQLVLLLSLFFAGFSARAQGPSLHFENLAHIPELASINANDILQDSRGFIWLASASGLYRWDGFEVKSYTQASGDLSARYAYRLYEDSEGYLWIGLFGGGLDRYNPQTEQFTHFAAKPEDPDYLVDGYITAIAEDKFHNIWIATPKGLNRMAAGNGKVQRFLNTESDYDGKGTIAGLLYDESGYLWAATNGGLLRFDVEQGNYQTLLPEVRALTLFKDSRGVLWVGTDKGLLRFDSDQIQQFFATEKAIDVIVEDHQGLLWIGSSMGGLGYLNRQSGQIRQIDSDYLLSAHKDRSDTLWFGMSSGLKKLTRPSRLIGYYDHGDPDGHSIMAIYQDSQNHLWLGTLKQGIYRYDEKLNLVHHYVNTVDNAESLSSGAVSSIVEDMEGRIWAATLGGGLNLINRKNHSVKHFRHNAKDDNSISHDSVHALYADPNGMLWAAGFRGLNRINPDTQQIQRYQHQPDDSNSLSSNNIMALFGDDKGILWIGTQKTGIDRFDSNRGKFTRFPHKPDDPRSLSHNFVSGIALDEQQQLWVSTYGGGLNRFDAEQSAFVRYRQSDGLSSDNVLALLIDRNNRLWISSEQGLSQFSAQSGESVEFGVEFGLNIDGYYLRSAHKNAQGELFFGGFKGYNRFDPQITKPLVSVPRVSFTKFLLFNREVPVDGAVLNKSILATDSVTLSYQQNLFSVEFAAIGADNPKQLSFQYQLAGWDEQWLNTDSKKRFATYSNLPSGDYALNVRAKMPGTAWGQSSTLNLKVTPAPWNTWWAWSAYVLLLTALIVLIYSLILQRRTADLQSALAEQEKQLALKDSAAAMSIAKTKDQLLANISHEFRTPLTLILGPLQTLAEKSSFAADKAQLGMIKRNAKRLLLMVDQLLDLASLKNNEHSYRQAYDIVAVSRFIAESFRPVLEQQNIKLELDLSTQDRVAVSMVPDSLEKILSNLLSNAGKYTPCGGTVGISLHQYSDDEVSLTVKDTGPGIESADLPHVFERFVRLEGHHNGISGVGIGLALVKELTESHGGRIEVLSEPGEGSEFSVILPLSAEPAVNVEPKVTMPLSYESEQKESVSVVLSDVKERPGILIVEDNPDMSRYLLDCFKPHYHCISAVDGEQGYQLAVEQMPDLIISDLMMPKMDGYQLAEKLRNDEKTSHIPLLMLTAKGDRQSRIKGWQNHVDEYIVKPFHLTELRVRVDNLLAIRANLRQQYGAMLGRVSPLLVDDDNQLSAKDRQFVEKFERCISESYQDSDLTRTAVAEQLFMTERQLNRKLGALFEHNFVEYLRKFRLRQSLDLLVQTDEPIVEVAESVGFTTSTYFARCFKAEYQVSPNQYRLQQRTEQASVT